MSDRPAARGRLRRFARGLLKWLLILWVVVTVASLAFNWLTAPPHTLAAPGGRDVTVSGARVHYQQWGTRGTPIVLVPGFAESSVSFSTVGPLLARDHVVYAVDLAGFGYTAYTGHYGVADEVALLRGFVAALHLDRPVLLGHSMGAAVVGGVALADPGAVREVIFADGDALPFPGQRGGPPGWLFHVPYVTSAYRLLTRWDWPASRIIAAQCGSGCPAVSSSLVDSWLRPFRQGAAEEALPAMAGAGVLHLTPQQIRAITVPRAIIWGAEDTSSGGSLAAARSNLGDPPTVVIPGAGHLSMLASPDAFAAAVDRLIAAG